MAEDIVDCVSHVVDVCLRVDLFTVAVDHNGSLSLFGGPLIFSFSSCPFLATLAQVPESAGCCGGVFALGVLCG